MRANRYHCPCITFGSFLRFHQQVEHNASFNQYVLHSLRNAVAKLRKRNGIDKKNEKNVENNSFSIFT